MEEGSLVELINDNWEQRTLNLKVNLPIKSVIYTIRSIRNTIHGIGITLEEIINEKQNFSDGFFEPIFYIKKFKELQPPLKINIENLNYEIV